MKEKKFLFQETLEELVAAGTVRVTGTLLTMMETGVDYSITPAVKIIRCETCEDDPNELVGKYAAYDNLTREGAEVFMSSIIYKKQSYQIEHGYICCHAPEKE